MAGNVDIAEGADEAEFRAEAVEERQAAAEAKDHNNVCLPASMFWRSPKLTAYPYQSGPLELKVEPSGWPASGAEDAAAPCRDAS
ncbi:hypothetical protein MKX07_006577 [Trichoderma sp. CBMAI-0711]|nr:hypothetical protein MKX07_006577 [Trichoderma sp. CBMAI-0711]